MEISGGYIKASALSSGNIGQDLFVTVERPDAYVNPASGTVVTGVSLNKPNDNEDLTYTSLGHAKITMAISLGAGSALMADGAGAAVLASSGQFVAGYLVSGASSGSVAEMIISPFRSNDAMG